MDTLGTATEQRGRPFQKGQSGNPRGRPKHKDRIRALARRHTAAALAALAEIAKRGASESARIAAANALLDRGWGKPATVAPEPETPEVFAFTIGTLSGPAEADEEARPRFLLPPDDAP